MSHEVEKTIFPYMNDSGEGLRVTDSVPGMDAIELDFPLRDDGVGGMAQTTEINVVRHYTRLSNQNFDIDRGMYPLGSCTMKHNPRINEAIAADPYWSVVHPYWPSEFLTGHQTIMDELAGDLATLGGFDAVSLMPAAGAHGELTSAFMMRAYHDAKGNTEKNVILFPDTAHGTNPASAAMAGFKCRQIPSEADGSLSFEAVKPYLDETVAGIMITNPNTLGAYETDFVEIADAIHELDGLVYMDGANFNAIMGVFRPGKIGADIMHWNLHKTFTTPHGGGGPGSGPIGFNEKLVPFAPESDGSESIGRVKAFFGQWGMFIRAWSYIRSIGGEGCRAVSEEAVLNANYLRHLLEKHLSLATEGPTLHETVFTDRDLPNGVTTKDLAKRLIDHGFHPPTIYFPIMVKGAIMVEPTETEPMRELERFAEAIEAIVQEAHDNPDLVKSAPQTTVVARVDEVRAARDLDLRYTAEQQ